MQPATLVEWWIQKPCRSCGREKPRLYASPWPEQQGMELARAQGECPRAGWRSKAGATRYRASVFPSSRGSRRPNSPAQLFLFFFNSSKSACCYFFYFKGKNKSPSIISEMNATAGTLGIAQESCLQGVPHESHQAMQIL